MHKRKAHATTTDMEMPAPIKARWTKEEAAMLAKEEARLTLEGERFLNQALERIFRPRTLEAIKGQRKKTTHKETVQQLITDMTTNRQTSTQTHTHTQGQGQQQQQQPPPQDYNNNNNTGSSPTLAHLMGLQTLNGNDYLATELQDIINNLTTRNTEDTLQYLAIYLRKIHPPPQASRKRRRKTPGLRQPTRRQQRRHEYAMTQLQWRQNRKRCITNILDGLGKMEQLPQKVMEPFWKEVMSGASNESPIPEEPTTTHHGIWAPIMDEEVQKAMLPRGTAKGPDGLSSRQLRAMPPGILSRIFNIILHCKRLPENLRTARTVFLPKIKDAKEPGDFRPITIPSVMTRCLHKILAARTSAAIKIDDRQRAFRPTDGCRDNTFLLDVILKYHHKRFKNVYMASLDVQKAFDSVSHIALMNVMRTLGCPREFIEYMSNTYKDGTTVLEGDGWTSSPILPEKGVKQGDPLSPIIFNMIMDQLLKKLSPEIGCRVGNECVNAAAFADDLFLFAQTPRGLQALIDIATKYLKSCGMTINAGKSLTIGIRANAKLKKTAVDVQTKFHCEGRTLRTLGRGEEIKYLGIKFTPEGRSRFTPQSVICPSLEKLTQAPLKPQQRLFALRFGLIPRVYYHLALGDVTISALKKVDVQVRQAVRKWLNLPHDVPTAYFHAEVKDGGLGIPSLRWTAPLHRMGRLTSLQGRHVQLRDEEMDRYLDEEIEKCKRRLRDGTPMLQMDDVKKRWAERLYESVDGKALRGSDLTPQQHRWIADGTRILQGRDFIKCVKARIGAIPTRSRTTRGRYADRRCRAGCAAQETLNHIVQHCHRTHGMRIKRHDAIAAYIARNMRRQGYQVQLEPIFQTDDGLRKPDLVATMGRTTIVVDAQVVSEQTNLDEAHQRKVDYYAKNPTLVTAIKEKEKSSDVKFQSVTMSWRGIWSPKSAKELVLLGVIKKNELKILSTRALIGTVAAYNLFSKITTVRRVGIG